MLTTTNIGAFLPDYLGVIFQTLSVFVLFKAMIVIFIGYLVILAVLKAYSIYLLISEKYIFLELKPTVENLKSSLATGQLFTAIYSLDRPQGLMEKFLTIQRSISLEIVSSRRDGIRYVMRIPQNLTPSVKKTIRAYLPGVDIREIQDYSAVMLNEKLVSVTKEFRLSKSFVLPMQTQKQFDQHDPIAYLTAHMTKLEKDENVSLQFICRTISRQGNRAGFNKVESIKKLLLNNEDVSHLINGKSSIFPILFISHILNTALFVLLMPFSLLGWLLTNSSDPLPVWILNGPKRKRMQEIGREKQELFQNVAEKIHQPLFDVITRLIIQSPSKSHITERIDGIRSAFNTFSTSSQSFALYWSPAQPFSFLRKNRLSLFGGTILSLSELSSLYHFPYSETTKTEDLLKVKSPKLPAPLSLKQPDAEFDIVFARNSYGETKTPIGLTLEERRRHMYLIGATGMGKTTLLLQMIYKDIISGKGIAVLDPHGDLAERLLGIIPEDRIKDVVYFNPYDTQNPIGLNVLELNKNISDTDLSREKDLIVSSLISVFHKLYPARYSGPRMEHVLRNTVLTALEVENPTLFTIYKLLTNQSYRKQIVATLSDPILKDFWKQEFEKLGSFQKADLISPITNKLGRFLTTSMTRSILNQNKSKLNFDDIMNSGKILICDLSKGKIGEDTSSFLGSLLIAKLQLAALNRVHIPMEERSDFFLYIDEFQNFATTTFAQILSEARKYRLNTILAHQTISQIEDKDLLKVILANVGTVISFRTSNPSDEAVILPLLTPQVEKNEISNLPSYNFYIKINALMPQDAFTGMVANFTVEPDKKILAKVIDYSRKTYGMEAVDKTGTTVKKTTVKKQDNVLKTPVVEAKKLRVSI